VHLLAANNTKVPVTLKMTTKEDVTTGHFTHIIHVRLGRKGMLWHGL
jgi:hypothetical protein